MKNSISITLLIILLSVCQSFSQKSMSELKLPYNSLNTMEKYLNKNLLKNMFPDNFEVTNFLYNKKYYSIKEGGNLIIGAFNYQSIKYIIYLRFPRDDYTNRVYEEWIKSVDIKGRVIDSLQTVFYTSYDGIEQRMLSTIPTYDRIEIEHRRLEWDLEKDDPNDLSKVKVFNGIFKIKNGRFIFENSLKLNVFFSGYYYGDIYSNINKTCQKVIKSTMADFNNDGINDVAYFLKKINPADCKEFDNSSLIICLADKHGLLQFDPSSILDWDNSSIQLNDLKVINSEINLTIMNKKTQVEYSVIGKLIKNDFKVLRITKNVPNSPLIFPNKKNQKVENIVYFLNDYEKSIK
jgi:hypothetical protein